MRRNPQQTDRSPSRSDSAKKGKKDGRGELNSTFLWDWRRARGGSLFWVFKKTAVRYNTGGVLFSPGPEPPPPQTGLAKRRRFWGRDGRGGFAPQLFYPPSPSGFCKQELVKKNPAV